MPIFIITLLLAGVVYCQQSSQEVYILQTKTLDVTTRVRVVTRAEKSSKINNQARHQPVKSIIADGTYVKEGDLLATFEGAPSQRDLDLLLLRQKVIETNLKRRLANIDNNNLDMDDQMGTLQDKLASLESKLERQMSEPTTDDIRIVEGRLKIAQMNLRAAQKDFEKAQERFARKMISRSELDAEEKDLKEKEAKELYARQELEVSKNPPDRDGNIQITRIEIESAKLEIAKLAYEIQEQLKISEIQRKGAVVNKERNAREIRDRRLDLEHVIVHSPTTGFLSINRFSGNEIVPGTRMWPNFAFMEIPDMDSVCMKGILPEACRQFYAEGDTVLLRMNGHKEEVLKGKLKSISTLSHDLAEKEDAAQNRDVKFGVKVFDIIISIEDKRPWLRPGMYGEADIISGKKITGPAAPLSYVKYEDGKSYISLDGVWTECKGTRVDAEFILEDAGLAGRAISASGAFLAKNITDGKEDERLSASGELLPVRSSIIEVKRIGWWPWPKITWLIPEETLVKKGDVVAKLDPQEREKQVLSDEERVTEAKSNAEELEKQVEITKRNGEHSIKTAELSLESTKISSGQVLDIVEPLPVYSAELSVKLAEIKLLDQKRKVQREESKATPTVSPAEMRKMRRELLRSELKLEQAQLKLESAREGKSLVEKSQAQLKLSTARDTYETARRKAIYDNLSKNSAFVRSRNWLRQVEKRLEFRREQVQNHTIVSPDDGLICYNKVWTNGAVTKVAVGNVVGPRFKILSLPDLSEMEMKVEIEEKYFSGIRIGMPTEVRMPSLGNRSLEGIVTGIDLLFRNKAKKDAQLGLYSSHEPLGEVVFDVRVSIKSDGVKLKPGLIGEVFFPITRK